MKQSLRNSEALKSPFSATGVKSVISRTHFPRWPTYDADDSNDVCEVLSSGNVNYWTGSNVREFEQEFASWLGAPHAVALANGTIALELALRALKIGEGDEVIVPATGFIADATAPIVIGATPVFADVNPQTQTITAETIAPLVTGKTRAIIAVHLGGMPCDMEPIISLADEHGLLIIEDCAQAHGARYRGRVVGGFGQAAAFSFCNDKIISTGGEGGMLLLKDEEAWERAWSYKDHGKRTSCLTDAREPGPYQYVHDTLGGNYRMTEMQAAIGRLQLRKLDGWLKIRSDNAMRLRQGLREVPAICAPEIPDYAEPAWYKAYAFVRLQELTSGWSRDWIIREINKAGVPCGSGGCPELYREKVIADRGIAPAKPCPVARKLGETSLMFRVDPALCSDHMDKTISVVRQVMAEATGS